jgi:uncharacterized cysteine cluster protein YcgN (CxxCxxCC family)
MADFCRKCAKRIGFDPDLTIERLSIPEEHMSWVLCEGCGYICIENVNGKEIVYRADREEE